MTLDRISDLPSRLVCYRHSILNNEWFGRNYAEVSSFDAYLIFNRKITVSSAYFLPIYNADCVYGKDLYSSQGPLDYLF